MPRHAAFDILYRDYYPRVFGLCRRLLSSTELAEDATQETFIRAYKRFGKFDTQQSFWHWIAAIANNHCIDLLRKRSRSERLFGDEDAEMAQATAPDAPALSNLIANQDMESLNRAIAELPDKYRVPLVLAYFHEDSYDAIAEQLEVTRNHVGVLLLRAKQRLRDALSSTEGAPG